MPDARGRLTLREAAAAFAVSRPTLSRALTAGELSGERDAAGAWRVEPAELARVYAPRRAPEIPAAPEAAPAAEIAELRAALAVETARREAAEALAAERAERIADLRRLLPGPEDAPRRRSRWPFGG